MYFTSLWVKFFSPIFAVVSQSIRVCFSFWKQQHCFFLLKEQRWPAAARGGTNTSCEWGTPLLNRSIKFYLLYDCSLFKHFHWYCHQVCISIFYCIDWFKLSLNFLACSRYHSLELYCTPNIIKFHISFRQMFRNVWQLRTQITHSCSTTAEQNVITQFISAFFFYFYNPQLAFINSLINYWLACYSQLLLIRKYCYKCIEEQLCLSSRSKSF